MAMLPAEDYEKLAALAEDRLDARAAEDAERRLAAGEEYVPDEVVGRLLSGESPLRVWREHRGLTLAAAGDRVGIRPSYLSEIERGLKPGTPSLWRKLSAELDVEIDDIMPM
jgi:hypothetical protein